MLARPRVLSVGQCGFDNRRISGLLQSAFEADVVTADSAAEALADLRASAFDLVLVNRVLDRDATTGLDLIRAVKGDPALASLPVILVSNYPEAQAEAVALGALPGFGKDELGSPKARECVARALGR